MNMKIKSGAFALALTIVANVTLAQYPPASHLATRWWQWALKTPASENPLTDTPGNLQRSTRAVGSGSWRVALAAQRSARLPCPLAKLCSSRL